MKFEDACIKPSITLKDAMEKMTRNKKNIIFVVENDKLEGALSDGDIRRAISNGVMLSSPVNKFMNINPAFAKDDKEAKSLFGTYDAIPVLNDDGSISKFYFRDEKKYLLIEKEDKKNNADKREDKKTPETKCVTIIPALNSSSSNNIFLAKINGTPLISLAVSAAKNSKHIDSSKIIVCSDNAAVLGYMKKTGIKNTILLNKETTASGDLGKAILYSLDYAKKNFNIKAECCVILKPESLMRTGEMIDNAINMLKGNSDSVFTVCELPKYLNPEKTAIIKDNKTIIVLKPVMNSDTKENKFFLINDLIYVLNIAKFERTKTLISESSIPSITSWDNFAYLENIDDVETVQTKARIFFNQP